MIDPMDISPSMIASAREALSRPLGEAEGLPGRFYGDAFYRVEQERLFPRSWCAVTVGARIPEPGDMLPVELGGWPILIVRGKSGDIRAFHNVCRHRAIRLVSQPTCAPRIRCPWHSWTYGLDGKLLATPDLGGGGVSAAPGFDKGALGLKPIAVGRWLDYVFVNIDGNAPPFDEYIAPAVALFAEYDLDRLMPAIPIRERYRGNWKLATEGGIEDYHLTFGHPQIEAHLFRNVTPCVAPGTLAGGATDVTGGDGDEPVVAWTARLPGLKTRAGAPLPRLYALNLFPTGTMLVAPDHVMLGVLLPDGACETKVDLQLYFEGDSATDPALEAARQGNLAMWLEVLPQDMPFVEAAQATIATRDAAGLGTRFSPYWEEGVRSFQAMVLDAVS